MTENRLRAGVIGVGRMGQFHVNCYSEIADVKLVGVADSDSAAGMAIKEKFGVEYFRDHRALLEQVDVATIAVPTGLHYEIAKTALEMNTHLLVEKPITSSYEDARELFRIAEEKGLVLHVGHVERFNGAVHELRQLVDDPILIQARRLAPFNQRTASDGVVLDMMIHDIDIILNLVNSSVKSINVMGRSVFTDRDDVVMVQIMFESGCMATITASRATQNKIRNMTISCRDKYIKLNFADQEISVHRMAASEHELRASGQDAGAKELRYMEAERRERIFVHSHNPLKLELQHLVDCILKRTERRVSVEKELRSLEVALLILEKFRRFNGAE